MNMLSKDEIRKLRDWMEMHHIADAWNLAVAMGKRVERGFRWQVVARALRGERVHPRNLAWIRQWMAAHDLVGPVIRRGGPCQSEKLAVLDGKSRASGEREE